MSKKKYTKCQCCPYYTLDFSNKKWRCSRSYCNFSYSDSSSLKENIETINRWINANKD